jgi:hypothetical protein
VIVTTAAGEIKASLEELKSAWQLPLNL